MHCGVERDLAYIKGPTGSRSSAQLYICVTMRHNTNVLLLFLVLFGLCSVNGYKLIDDNLQDEEDPEWNQVIGNSFGIRSDQIGSNQIKSDHIGSKWIKSDQNGSNLTTLKSLIEEHARLDFSDFLSTLLAIFHVINEKFHPARLLIYLVKKQAG